MVTKSTFILALLIVCLAAPSCSKSSGPVTVSTNAAVDSSLSPEEQAIQAADAGNLSALTALLKKNPGLSAATDANGSTPLHLLMLHRYWDKTLVQTLLKGGANANAPNAQGASPLDIADENMAPPEIMELLRGPARAASKK